MISTIQGVKRWWHNGRADGEPQATTHDAEVETPRPWLARLEEVGVPLSLTYPATTLARMLDQTADRFANATGLIYGDGRWTYGELRRQVNRLAAGLAQLGVRKQDRVLMTLPNCPEFVISFFAIQKLGAVLVNAGPLLGPDDLDALVALTRPRALIGIDLQMPLLSGAGRDAPIEHRIMVSLQCYQPLFKRIGYQYKVWHEHRHLEDHTRDVHLETLVRNAPPLPPTLSPDPEDLAVLQPTGGTTGSLKLAELSHHNLLANAMQVSSWLPFRPGQERVLAVLPMFHVFGLTCCLTSSILSGATIIALTRFNVTQVLSAIRRHRPTLFPLVPAICEAISNELEAHPAPGGPRGRTVCICGAAPLPPAVAERFGRLTGATVVEGYGLTEAAPVTHANLPGRNRFGSIGVPMPDTRVRIMSLEDDRREVGAHEPGELWVAGPQVMRGYFRNPLETSRALVTDEEGTDWLRTGDIMEYDEQGFFRVIDRKKDMINHSGLKVYPSKVEKLLLTHNQVAEAAVVGRPDPVHTETVVAVVVPTTAPQDAGALGRALKVFCLEHLAPYEVPAVFEFVEALPKSPLGKLLRRELRRGPAASPAGGTPSPVSRLEVA